MVSLIMANRIDNNINKTNDNYYTPLYLANWAIKYGLDILSNNCNISMLEPGCGEFYPFARSAAKLGVESHAFDNQIDFSNETLVDNITLYNEVSFLDCDQMENSGLAENKYDLIATNPPFSKAEEFIWKSLDMLEPRGVMIMLLKLPFLASKSRRVLFNDRPPKEVFVIQRRPSFVVSGDKMGKTDMTEYGFFVWLGDGSDDYFRKYGGRDTILRWLDNTRLEGYVVGRGISKIDKGSEKSNS